MGILEGGNSSNNNDESKFIVVVVRKLFNIFNNVVTSIWYHLNCCDLQNSFVGGGFLFSKVKSKYKIVISLLP